MIEDGTRLDERLLRAWERGLSGRPAQRAAALLRELGAIESEEHLLTMTVGERDRALFDIRCALFGHQFVAAAACGCCGKRVEIGFSAADVLPETHTAMRTVRIHQPDDLVIEAAAPTVADLAVAGHAADAGDATQILLQRCVRSAWQGNREIAFEALPGQALEALQAQLEETDPFAALELQIHCPHCGNVTESDFDIADFLWREVEAEAMRLLRDVHVLARQYGWREADIIAMSPLRRQMYVEMANA